MSNSRGAQLAVYLGLFCVTIMFSAGCAQKQQAIDLYVDAVMLVEDGDNSKAIEKLDSAIQVNETFSLAYSLLGDIYFEINDYEKSAVSYENASDLNPWSFKDFFKLGKVNQIMKKFRDAVAAYTRACQLKPNHLEANIGAAQSYYGLADYDNALEYGRRAENIDADVSEIQKLFGDIYLSKKQYEQAISAYRRALELDSDNPQIMNSLAILYLNTDRNQAAKELLRAVVLLQPENGDAYRYLGYCFLRLKNIDESIDSYGKAIQINAEDWDARRQLGVAYIFKGKRPDGFVEEALKKKAIEQWRMSLAIEPDQRNRRKLLSLIEKLEKQTILE